MTVDAGGNSIIGSVTVHPHQLRVSALSTTLMHCPPAVMQAEDQLKKIFTGNVPYTLKGGVLRLTPTPDQELVFTPPITTLRDFTGQLMPWDSTHPAFNQQTAADVQLHLTANGQLTGTTGCNQFHGTVNQTQDTLSVPNLGMSRKSCGPERDALESAWVDFLAGPLHFQFLGARLTLTDTEGFWARFKHQTDDQTATAPTALNTNHEGN